VVATVPSDRGLARRPPAPHRSPRGLGLRRAPKTAPELRERPGQPTTHQGRSARCPRHGAARSGRSCARGL